MENQTNTQLPKKDPLNPKYFILGALLFVITLGLGFFLGRYTSNPGPVEHKDYFPLQPSPTSTSEAVEESSGWSTHTIDLYKLQLSLPTGWTIQEINRRPEPKEVGSPLQGHDCAEYRIQGNKETQLSLQPVCGFSDGGPINWPPDTYIVKQSSENYKTIIRYFEQQSKATFYAMGGESGIEDEQGKRIINTHSGKLFYGAGKEAIAINARLYYGGVLTTQEELQLVDQIVSSLKTY